MSSTSIPPGTLQPGGFPSLTQPPATKFTVGDVPAPTSLYIGDDSFLRVTVRNVGAATVLTVRTRAIRSDDGGISVSEDVLRPPSTGVQTVFNVPLTEGFLLSAIITADGGVVTRGSVFCSIEIAHGSQQAPHRDALLVQDYVASGYAAAWPGGILRLSTEGPGTSTLIQPGAPGAGFELAVAFVANQRILLKSYTVTFTTSAAVANRVPVFSINESGAPVYSVGIVGAIPASTVATLVFGAGIPGPSVNNNIHLLPLPPDLRVSSLANISTLTTALQAGDNYGVSTAIVETWIDS